MRFKDKKNSNMKENILKKIGLTDAETKVFLELIKIDSASASELSKKVNIYRTNVYDILESLIQKGLVSYIIRENKKYFAASKPQKLLDYLKEKEEKLKEQEAQVIKLISLLAKLKTTKKEELKAEIYRGKEGLKTLLNDILNSENNYFCFGYSAVSQKIIPEYFKLWHKKRIKGKIKRMILTKEQMRNSTAVKLPLTKVKYLQDEFNTPISTMIYGDKVWVLIPTDQNDHISLLIESYKLAQSLLNYFHQLWKVAKI